MTSPARIPVRLAFVHIMRTGGTSLFHFLAQELAETHQICDSWSDGLERDWTTAEILDLAQQPGQLLVHNHVFSWDQKLVALYRRVSFKTFAVVRPVGDQLCSLYYWIQKKSPGWLSCSLDQFLVEQLTGVNRHGIHKQHWEIPKWWHDIDFVRPLTSQGLQQLLVDDLHFDEAIAQELLARHENSSPNPGYQAALAAGLIAESTERLLATSASRRRYCDILAQHMATSSQSS